jgi:hypothetical protein
MALFALLRDEFISVALVLAAVGTAAGMPRNLTAGRDRVVTLVAEGP